MASEPTAMSADKIARDLASVGCGCDEEVSVCPSYRDGYCHRAPDAIASALSAAYTRGQQDMQRRAVEVAKGNYDLGSDDPRSRAYTIARFDAASAISALAVEKVDG